MKRSAIVILSSIVLVIVLAAGAVGAGTIFGGDADTLFARVNAQGSLAASYGTVSSTRTAEGEYSITFKRSITGCALIGQTNPIGDEEFYKELLVTIKTVSGSTATVRVRYAHTDVAADSSFALTATCKPV